MESKIETFTHPDGQIQRLQVVKLDSWAQLEYLFPASDPAALEGLSRIYSRYLIPACPWVFGSLVLFRIPKDVKVPFEGRYGAVESPLTAAALALRRGVRVIGGKPVFFNKQIKPFWDELWRRDCIRIVRGFLPTTTIIPVGDALGLLSRAEPSAAMKVNASFFIMDPFDCATPYDHVGTHLGLCVRSGVVENPPLFGREALLVRRDGSVSVEHVDISRLGIEINGKRYTPGKNARLYTRPGRSHTPLSQGKKLVIVGCRVAAVSEKLRLPIPASGFVLCPEEVCDAKPGDRVRYSGMEEVSFGVQVGNSILRDGVKTEAFLSKFYNIRRLQPVPFPPCLYPMDFQKSRAARIALGADQDGKPMLLWAEGAGKLGHIPGQESCGATLADMAQLCSRAGMVNAVNLDGGGSAQILWQGKRLLKISDRREDNTEYERAVPIALMVR